MQKLIITVVMFVMNITTLLAQSELDYTNSEAMDNDTPGIGYVISILFILIWIIVHNNRKNKR